MEEVFQRGFPSRRSSIAICTLSSAYYTMAGAAGNRVAFQVNELPPMFHRMALSESYSTGRVPSQLHLDDLHVYHPNLPPPCWRGMHPIVLIQGKGASSEVVSYGNVPPPPRQMPLSSINHSPTL